MSSVKEVIVIGAGIIGASIAWHLTGAGARVTV
ncbi:MAG: FAD-binding oxidoreductase, partial [Mesorhizobium sp.]